MSGSGAGSCWWTVVAEWRLLVVLVWKSVGDKPTWKAESGARVGRAET